MDKNKNCSACNIKFDKDIYKIDRTICTNCYNEKERKNKNNNTIIQNQQAKNDIVNNNNRMLLVGSNFSAKTHFLLKIFSRKLNRDFYIIAKSPPEQYSNSKIKIKEIGDEIKPLNEYQNAIVVSDDTLGSSNNRYIDQFLIKERRNNLDIYYLSQSYFYLTKNLYKKLVLKKICLIKR